jgi:hypothetical protein
MNSERKRWAITIGASVLCMAATGYLIMDQESSIETARLEIDSVNLQIAADRALIKQSPDLVKKVIIQREVDAAIQEILPNESNLKEFVDTLHRFSEESGVKITSLADTTRRQGAAASQAFRPLGYSIQFEGDAFQLLSYLNKVESGNRFMRVPSIDLSAAPRGDYDSDEVPVHSITMDLESYVYNPQARGQAVEVSNYDRKRALLVSEISQRTAELRVIPYVYRGHRNRRDPWIDPRVRIEPGQAPPTIAEQNELVYALVQRVEEAKLILAKTRETETILEEMKARSALDKEIAFLQSEIDRVEREGSLVYVIAVKKFETEVVGGVAWLVAESKTSDVGQGPSEAALTQAEDSMETYIKSQQFELAIEVFQTIEPGLEFAEADEQRLPKVQTLRELKRLSETVLSFEKIELTITGLAIYKDARPMVLINGHAVREGELIGDEVIVRNIEADLVQFAYRGVVLGRAVNLGSNN